MRKAETGGDSRGNNDLLRDLFHVAELLYSYIVYYVLAAVYAPPSYGPSRPWLASSSQVRKAVWTSTYQAVDVSPAFS